MVTNVDIVEYEDPSLHALINQTAKDLHKKYNKQRKVNEKFLKQKTPVQKGFSIIFDIVCVCCLFCAFTICYSIFNTTLHGYLPNFAGYSNLIVSSKSMVKSGFEVGDIVIIHSVDTNTLIVNDNIAFYVYVPSYANFDVSTATNVSDQQADTKYTLTVKQLFGYQTESIEKATSRKSDLVFHHIRAIYEDENGERWFKTYGSSNGSDDSWWVHQDFVVGIQDEGALAKGVLGLVDFVAQPYGFWVLLIPVGVMLLILIFAFLRNVQIAKLELDCVEEKRKITDEICVKNEVGYQMGTKTKFKILAQATDENKEEYIKLLWKNGKTPKSVEKYYKRRKLDSQDQRRQ